MLLKESLRLIQALFTEEQEALALSASLDREQELMDLIGDQDARARAQLQGLVNAHRKVFGVALHEGRAAIIPHPILVYMVNPRMSGNGSAE